MSPSSNCIHPEPRAALLAALLMSLLPAQSSQSQARSFSPSFGRRSRAPRLPRAAQQTARTAPRRVESLSRLGEEESVAPLHPLPLGAGGCRMREPGGSSGAGAPFSGFCARPCWPLRLTASDESGRYHAPGRPCRARTGGQQRVPPCSPTQPRAGGSLQERNKEGLGSRPLGAIS